MLFKAIKNFAFFAILAWPALLFAEESQIVDSFQVVSGQVSVQMQNNGSLRVIKQLSDKAIINWNTFNIGSDETTEFIVPNAGGITLNRVTGSSAPHILGSLHSNGQVMLDTPQPAVFGPNTEIDTAGTLMGNLQVSNAQFLNKPAMPSAALPHSTASTGSGGSTMATVGSALASGLASFLTPSTAKQRPTQMQTQNQIFYTPAGSYSQPKLVRQAPVSAAEPASTGTTVPASENRNSTGNPSQAATQAVPVREGGEGTTPAVSASASASTSISEQGGANGETQAAGNVEINNNVNQAVSNNETSQVTQPVATPINQNEESFTPPTPPELSTPTVAQEPQAGGDEEATSPSGEPAVTPEDSVPETDQAAQNTEPSPSESSGMAPLSPADQAELTDQNMPSDNTGAGTDEESQPATDENTDEGTTQVMPTDEGDQAAQTEATPASDNEQSVTGEESQPATDENTDEGTTQVMPTDEGDQAAQTEATPASDNEQSVTGEESQPATDENTDEGTTQVMPSDEGDQSYQSDSDQSSYGSSDQGSSDQSSYDSSSSDDTSSDSSSYDSGSSDSSAYDSGSYDSGSSDSGSYGSGDSGDEE